MRIGIDTDVCIGAGQCALTAPGVFTQDDDGFSALLPGREDGAGDPLVREAARVCPVQAITLDD
ncbi:MULTISPECIES: ferredoxin [unclassified Streptomyces]|uniref:ferredoxin n=1 Tax=unclassified Streptomyces TaxID=2593676 RepID=UPI000C26DDA8|nr:ferredoxin [Streptomyces sp. CB01201]PJN04669.1 ferredoxin [Streptomyces sp. CB01201]